jgi:hypothetical protein
MVIAALTGDVLKSVDSAQTDLKLLTPEVFNRPCKVVGDAALTIGLYLCLVTTLSRGGLNAASVWR